MVQNLEKQRIYKECKFGGSESRKDIVKIQNN